MAPSFSLTVPADARYRTLGPDVAGKYVELAGGGKADAATFHAAVSEALDQIAPASSPDVDVALAFEATAGGVEVTMTAAGRSTSVRHPLPAASR